MIAAGEVVERPATALKELMENSIDSSATRIDVDLTEGGLGKMQVRDNGVGISAAELTIAVQPHTTSKLETLAQLSVVETMGFRGEALASIAALGNLTMRSRQQDKQDGAELKLQGSYTDEQPIPCVCVHGTEVTVTELFVHAPARRKFAGKGHTEWGHCDLAWRSTAIANPDIAFSLARDGKIVKEVSAQTRKDRVFQMLGPKFAESAKEISAEIDPFAMQCFVNFEQKTDRNRQFIVLNGRSIKESYISMAIRKACEDVMRPHSFPFALFLDMPPELFDVNAHPAKLEVRFREKPAVFNFIYAAIKHAFEEPLGNNPNIPFNRPEPNKKPRQATKAQIRNENKRLDLLRELLSNADKIEKTEDGDPLVRMEINAQDLVPETDEKAQKKELGDVIGMLHGIYVIAENEKGLVVVDLHAAHERIIYEDLKQKMDEQEVSVQFLLQPILLEDLTPLETDALTDFRQELQKIGFTISEEEGVFRLDAIPQILVEHVDEPAKLMFDCLNELATSGKIHSHEEIRNRFLSTAACHSAVRGQQQYFTRGQLNQLLRKMEQTPRSGLCNHGRPTWRLIELKDFDGYFDRGN